MMVSSKRTTKGRDVYADGRVQKPDSVLYVVQGSYVLYSHKQPMKARTIKVSMYVILVLVDTTIKAFLQDAYMEASFTFTIDHADESAVPEALVTDQMIHERLTQFFENQEALPKLKEQYPTLPDFVIGSGKLFSE